MNLVLTALTKPGLFWPCFIVHLIEAFFTSHTCSWIRWVLLSSRYLDSLPEIKFGDCYIQLSWFWGSLILEILEGKHSGFASFEFPNFAINKMYKWVHLPLYFLPLFLCLLRQSTQFFSFPRLIYPHFNFYLQGRTSKRLLGTSFRS